MGFVETQVLSVDMKIAGISPAQAIRIDQRSAAESAQWCASASCACCLQWCRQSAGDSERRNVVPPFQSPIDVTPEERELRSQPLV